jgi:hypothetical protein
LDDAAKKAEEILRAGCKGKECEGWEKAQEASKTPDHASPKPGPDTPAPTPKSEAPPTEPPAVQAYDPGRDMNFVDRWIWGGTGAFHDAVTSDENLRQAQTVATAVAVVGIVGVDVFATGGATTGALLARGTPSMLAALAGYAATHPEVVSEVTEEGATVAITVRNGIGVMGSVGPQGIVTLEELMEVGATVAPRLGALQGAMLSNPMMVSQAPGISQNFVNVASRYPGLASAVYGKAFELFSARLMPNMVQQLGGANQPDAVIRIGNSLVAVDWTTWGQAAQHMDRVYYQFAPFLFFLHVGFR